MIGRRNVRFLVLEGFVVLFGVLAALLVEAWWQDGQAAAEADAAMERLTEEVRRNLVELVALDSVVTRRLELLTGLETELGRGASLADLVSRFDGYRSPDLAAGAWQRVNSGAVVDHAPEGLIQDAFTLYSLHHYFLRLDEEIDRLVYGESFHDPERSLYAWRISRRIMNQQVVWAREFIPQHESFLERYGAAARTR